MFLVSANVGDDVSTGAGTTQGPTEAATTQPTVRRLYTLNSKRKYTVLDLSSSQRVTDLR